MANERRHATIRDVAERAGVSTATVSRALRGGTNVDPGTRREVERAARELRYRPSGVARSLKLRVTQTIGLIVTDIENPFFPHLVRAVEDAARVRGYSVILADGRRDPDREIASLEVLARRQVDGLLLASSALTDRHRRWIDERPCPVAIINSASTDGHVPAVLSDNESGGRMVAQHLGGLGHRKLAYLGVADSDNVAIEERLRGLRSQLEQDGNADELITAYGQPGVEGAEALARDLLRREPGVTALACYNDLTAVGALRGLRSLRLRVPGDVSVVGFDDIELAPYVDPPLTTVRQATDEIGRWAVDILLDEVLQQATPVRAPGGAHSVSRGDPVRRIAVELVVRSSSGPVRDGDPAPD